MWNYPSSKELAIIPSFYSTEKVPLKEKKICMHFFVAGCDWYACEYDPKTKRFFGFAILNNDYQSAEWGYFSLVELSDFRLSFLEVDRDVYFTPRRAADIYKICRAQGW